MHMVKLPLQQLLIQDFKRAAGVLCAAQTIGVPIPPAATAGIRLPASQKHFLILFLQVTW